MLKLQALIVGVVVTTGLAQPALAQTYPSQNVTVLVAFPAGGLADIIARLVSTKLEARLKQSVVVENRGGAGGNIAAKTVFTAAPDGYTLLATTTGLAVNMTASKNRGFEMDDIRPVAIVAISPDVIAIHPSNPAKDLKEFIANAKTKASPTAAPASAPARRSRGVFLQGVAKVNYALRSGRRAGDHRHARHHVDSLVLTLPPVTPHIKSGALRGLGVASEKRNSAIPDVPTYGEMGYPNVYSQSWVGFFAPAKTPDAVVQKLNTEINALMKEPDSLEKIAKSGFDPVVKNVAETSDYFKSEVASWGKMVNAIGFSN